MFLDACSLMFLSYDDEDADAAAAEMMLFVIVTVDCLLSFPSCSLLIGPTLMMMMMTTTTTTTTTATMMMMVVVVSVSVLACHAVHEPVLGQPSGSMKQSTKLLLVIWLSVSCDNSRGRGRAEQGRAGRVGQGRH